MELALTTVAQWTGSAIIRKLVETAYSYMGKCMLPVDTESQLSRLNAALPKIIAVMGVAEELKFKHPNSAVTAWLEKFKEAFLAAEDVLDELKYRELEYMVKNQDQVSGSSTSTVKKKIYSLKKNLSGFSKKKEKIISGSSNGKDILKRLWGAVQMLDLVASDVGPFMQFATAVDVHGLTKPNNQPAYTSNRETTSLLTERKVFGRETEKDMIIEWLKKPASHGNISALCIVGAGGLGKTTLVQLIFEEISRESHFDETIWVCVSTSFSVEDITRKILQELGGKGHDNESLNRLQINLKEKVLSKKVLFILDDVWNDEKMCDWEKLIAPLKYVQPESKILLTTRMKSVTDMFARVLNTEQENLVLEGLKEQELLEVLNKYAFYGYNPDNHRDLQKIGNDIVKKLRGSPLAAKMIGSLLNSYMDFHYWKRILSYDSLINLEQAKDVVDVLKLSYYHLPAHLQECFRFCSIFPQDYDFKKDELIKMWMASGFIRQELCGGERPEDIGEEYFNHLLRKSFLDRHSWAKNVYVMHDLMHDLAHNVSKGECCRVERNDKYDIIPNTAQHVSIHKSKIERTFNLTNLRTLVITGVDDVRDQFVFPSGSIKETLRLLVIPGAYNCELTDEIGRLIHLRFLEVKRVNFMSPPNRYFVLSNSICKLYHLQVLKIEPFLKGIETTGMADLVSLRYMKLPDQVMQTIHGVHKLTSLQKLNFFVGWESGCHIDELKKLFNLRTLSIQKIENVEDPVEATKANLSKKESLTSLSLNWTRWSNNDINHEQVIDYLRPHPNLKKLRIQHYTGHKSPIWMRDSSHLDLSSLSLDDCPFWEALPILSQMPHLKKLSLFLMNEVKEVEYSCGSTSDCAFPSLERLYCRNMPKWKSWAGSHSCYGFPNLKELEITNCPKLEELPSIPSSLFKFVVHNVGLNSLPDMHHGSSITAPTPSCMKSSLREVDIFNCPNLLSLNGFMQQQNLDLQAIEKLTIARCKNLSQLPTEGFGKLTSLKYLTIIADCPNLKKLPNLPLSLIEFAIYFVALSDLPDYFISSHSSGLTSSSSLKASLSKVMIFRCSHLTSLNGFLVQENIDLGGLEKLSIFNCKNLVQLPTGAFQKFESLKQLDIRMCPQLVTVDIQSILLPVRLESLEMGNNGELDVPLLKSASQLYTLTSLSIENSTNITCIPSSENAFTSLRELKIRGCDKLIEFSSRQQAHTVHPGNNLVSLKIRTLYIDRLCLLLVEPIRCLQFVSDLKVSECSGMEALPEQWLLQNSSTLKELSITFASSLRSLPGTMVMLTALEKLHIHGATSLEEIPELPTSLVSKLISPTR